MVATGRVPSIGINVTARCCPLLPASGRRGIHAASSALTLTPGRLCFEHRRFGENFPALAGVRASKGSPHCAQRDRHTASVVSVPLRRVWGSVLANLKLPVEKLIHLFPYNRTALLSYDTHFGCSEHPLHTSRNSEILAIGTLCTLRHTFSVPAQLVGFTTIFRIRHTVHTLAHGGKMFPAPLGTLLPNPIGWESVLCACVCALCAGPHHVASQTKPLSSFHAPLCR
jgi:hypothetical protein